MRNNVRLKRKDCVNILSYVCLVLLSIIFLYPILFLAANSLRHYITKAPVYFFTEHHFENYYFAVVMIDFVRYLLNSLKLVVITIFGSLVMDFLVGYAFARLRAPGRDLLFKLVLLQLMIPYIAIQIPQFVWYNSIGLMDSYWIFILNALGGSAYNIFMVKQFISSFPKEIEEAAKMDGCGFIRQILQIIIPCSKPLYALLLFNSFVGGWNDAMGPQMFMTEENYPLATAMYSSLYFLANKPEITLEPITLALCVIATIPVIALFFCLQKYLVQGIVTTGLKG